MGDTGSLTIGMILCILCLRLLQYSTTEASAELPNILVLAYSPLLIPCLDVVRVYLHRVRNGKIHFYPTRITFITNCLPWECANVWRW